MVRMATAAATAATAATATDNRSSSRPRSWAWWGWRSSRGCGWLFHWAAVLTFSCHAKARVNIVWYAVAVRISGWSYDWSAVLAFACHERACVRVIWYAGAVRICAIIVFLCWGCLRRRFSVVWDKETRVAQEHKEDRKSTRLNSSHQLISYAVFCLKKKKHKRTPRKPRHRKTTHNGRRGESAKS